MKAFTVDIKVEDSSQETVHVEPVVDEDNVFIGVYKLYKSPPDQFNYLGDIAFNQEYTGDWEYTGDILNIEEQEQIAERIMEHNLDQDSFNVQAFYKGSINSFEVMPIENYFVIAFDGKYIAKIQHSEDWVQIEGEPLNDDLIVTLKQAIEDHYD